jgi:hypothetical protein
MWPLILASLCRSVCETHGVHLEFGSVERDLASAYYDSAHDSGSHYIVFTGSFLPTVSGSHTFTVTCYTYFTSFLMPAAAHLEWDELPVMSGRNTWTWTAELQKDFRYSYKCTTDDNFYYATLEFDVLPPGGRNATVDTQYSDTCTDMGCRNLSLTREENCEPPSKVTVKEPLRESAGEVDRSRTLPRGAIAGVAVAGVAVVGVVALVGVGIWRYKRKNGRQEELESELLSNKEPD